jgi:hypothetical protein
MPIEVTREKKQPLPPQHLARGIRQIDEIRVSHVGYEDPMNPGHALTFNINHIHKSQKVIAKDNSNEPFGSKMMKLITDEEIMMMPGFVPQLVKDKNLTKEKHVTLIGEKYHLLACDTMRLENALKLTTSDEDDPRMALLRAENAKKQEEYDKKEKEALKKVVLYLPKQREHHDTTGCRSRTFAANDHKRHKMMTTSMNRAKHMKYNSVAFTRASNMRSSKECIDFVLIQTENMNKEELVDHLDEVAYLLQEYNKSHPLNLNNTNSDKYSDMSDMKLHADNMPKSMSKASLASTDYSSPTRKGVSFGTGSKNDTQGNQTDKKKEYKSLEQKLNDLNKAIQKRIKKQLTNSDRKNKKSDFLSRMSRREASDGYTGNSLVSLPANTDADRQSQRRPSTVSAMSWASGTSTGMTQSSNPSNTQQSRADEMHISRSNNSNTSDLGPEVDTNRKSSSLHKLRIFSNHNQHQEEEEIDVVDLHIPPEHQVLNTTKYYRSPYRYVDVINKESDQGTLADVPPLIMKWDREHAVADQLLQEKLIERADNYGVIEKLKLKKSTKNKAEEHARHCIKKLKDTRLVLEKEWDNVNNQRKNMLTKTYYSGKKVKQAVRSFQETKKNCMTTTHEQLIKHQFELPYRLSSWLEESNDITGAVEVDEPIYRMTDYSVEKTPARGFSTIMEGGEEEEDTTIQAGSPTFIKSAAAPPTQAPSSKSPRQKNFAPSKDTTTTMEMASDKQIIGLSRPVAAREEDTIMNSSPTTITKTKTTCQSPRSPRSVHMNKSLIADPGVTSFNGTYCGKSGGMIHYLSDKVAQSRQYSNRESVSEDRLQHTRWFYESLCVLMEYIHERRRLNALQDMQLDTYDDPNEYLDCPVGLIRFIVCLRDAIALGANFDTDAGDGLLLHLIVSTIVPEDHKKDITYNVLRVSCDNVGITPTRLFQYLDGLYGRHNAGGHHHAESETGMNNHQFIASKALREAVAVEKDPHHRIRNLSAERVVEDEDHGNEEGENDDGNVEGEEDEEGQNEVEGYAEDEIAAVERTVGVDTTSKTVTFDPQ